MTITLLAPDGVAITAQQERQARAAGHGGGSGRQLGGRSGFRVGTPSTVLSATSTTWTLGPCAAMIDPGAGLHQGMYGWSSDANVTGTVTAADATNPRKDIVYILVNDSTAGDGSGAVNASPVYVAGTPGATPSAPAVPARGFLVGTINVPVAGGGSPTVTLNPARYVAAGGVLPVADDAERDALDKYPGLQVVRTDKNGRVDTWNGTAWWWIGKSNIFTRAVGTDSNPGDITGTTTLVSGSITGAPAGKYRISGRVCLYATSGTSRGFVFVTANGTTDEARNDFPGDSNPRSLPTEFEYVHAGGDLPVGLGYRQTAGSPLVTGAASGITRLSVTLIGN